MPPSKVHKYCMTKTHTTNKSVTQWVNPVLDHSIPSLKAEQKFSTMCWEQKGRFKFSHLTGKEKIKQLNYKVFNPIIEGWEHFKEEKMAGYRTHIP